MPRIPESFSFGEIEPDWERISPFLEAAMGRVPRCLEAQLAQEAVHPARRHRPPAPAWCLRGPRPLLRTPERTLSIMEARRGCSSPPQAAPKLRILSAFYLQEVGAKKLFCGPESFTPDLGPIVGEAPELRNYYVAAGMNSIGILTGGGVGRALAHQIVHGAADVDVTAMLPARFHRNQATPGYRGVRVVESLGKVYKCHYPHRPTATARRVRRSPLHAQLAARGACFCAESQPKEGWSRR